MMCYYNATMFEEYGVKTPKEYFLEGNWTWDTFLEVMIQMTKDTNGDGRIDTYGLPGDSWHNLVNSWKTNSKGELVSVIDEPWVRDFFQLKYEAFTVKKCSIAGANRIQTNVINPMFAMQLSDCEPYNFEHMFQSIANGDELEVVPAPEWVGKDGAKLSTSKVTQACVSLAATCDEREAAFDLLVYLMKCGLKYVSDFSFGAVKCDYAGILGTSELSKQWKAAFAEQMKEREATLATLEGLYDADHMTKVMDYYNKISGWHAFTTYGGIKSLLGYAEITQMPPASSIPAVKEKHQAALDKYNDLYVFS
jgi:hypothetical protein